MPGSPGSADSSKPTYLIIGAGVFGISTAYHILLQNPSANVTILDRDAYDASSRVAASWDWNKVVRADYDDKIYCRLALEAQDVFRSDPLWRPYFHETGIYWLCRSDYARDVIANYAALGRKADLEAVSVEEARDLYGGVFDQADLEGVKEVLVNKSSGWAAAGDCLVAVTAECLRLGARFVVGEVRDLLFDERARCYGVRTANAGTWTAEKVVLCTGAYTAKLLEKAALSHGVPALSAGDRIVAGGITTGMTRLNEWTYDHFKDMPVGVQGYTAETGPFIGSLPPTKDKELKWWGQTIFRNTQKVIPGGRGLSMPPAEPDYAQWKVSKRLEADIEHARDVFYGKKGKSWKMEKHRICWDAFTTSSDFIISPHSAASSGLYIATCGNFHGWKFFPIIGRYVLQMLEGQLEPELVQKWAWDRERPDPKFFADWPRVEMRELVEEGEVARL